MVWRRYTCSQAGLEVEFAGMTMMGAGSDESRVYVSVGVLERSEIWL